MKNNVKAVFLTSVLYLFLTTSLSFSQTQSLNISQKLTTHTADDFQPDVSPDGKSVAFLSNRSGNNDIWLIPIGGGSARQLTTHTASDTDPAWSRDGKRIAFTSLRDDSKGDIWVLDLESWKETRIADSRAAESHPSWFPDGKKIVFSRSEEVWSIDLQTHKEERLFRGLYPSVSPDGRVIAYISFEREAESDKAEGMIWIYRIADKKAFQLTSGNLADAFPSWSPDGKEIYFSRFSEDTNGGGNIDLKDNPSIWKIDFSSEFDNQKLETQDSKPVFQLTSGSSYELFPSITANSIVFASARGKDLDIYRISRDGEVPRLKTAKDQLDLAYKVKDPWPAILAFRKVYLSGKSGDEGIFAEARYRVALTYLTLGHKRDAVRELQSLTSAFPKGRRYFSLAKIELSKIKVAEAVSAGDKDGASREIDKLKGIIDGYEDQTYSQAMAQLEIGNIYLSLKDDVQALKEYEVVREKYSDEVDAAAQARLNMADIYLSYGDEARLIDTYVSIIKDYPNSSEWCLTTSQRVLSLIERTEDERERLSRYREIAAKYKGLPYLPAMAQYKVGELYHTKGRYDEALLEYKRVTDDFPSDTAIADEANLAMAEIELSKGAYSHAIAIYDGLMKRGDPRGKKLYRDASLKKAWAQLLGKEPAQAIRSYKAVIDLDYSEVRAHRGMIEAYAMKGEPEKAVAIYIEDVKRLPGSETAHYALGLSYTYIEPPALVAAESEVKKALSIDYSFPFAHQTLGWIYEVKDKMGKEKTLGAAVDEYQVALALLMPSDKQQSADLLLNIGNGYSALGNHEKGYEFYKRRLETGVSFDDLKREAVFYENLGNAASRIGKYKEAVPYYMKARDYAVKVKDRSWELKITEELALLYQEARDYANAADYFSQALKIAEKEKMSDKKALLLRNIAYNYYHAGRVEEAIGLFNKSLDALDLKEEVATGEGGLLTIKKALALGKEGSEAFMGFEKKGEEKLIYSYLGRAYLDTGEYESALDELLKKLERIAEGRDTEKGIVLNNIGFLYYQMGDAEKAYNYFNGAMDVSRKAKNLTGEMVNIVNIGLLGTNNPPHSPLNLRGEVKLQERGINLIESEKRGLEYLPYLKNNLGLLYLKEVVSGQWPVAGRGGVTPPSDLNLIIKSSLDSINHDRDYFKKATEYFKDGLNTLKDKKEPWLAAVMELNLATSLYYLGDDKEASDHLASAMKISEENSLTDIKWRGLWLMSKLDDKNSLKSLEDAVAALDVGAGLAPAQIGQPQGSPLQKELIYLLFSRGKIDEAFSYAERMEMSRIKSDAARARYPLPKMEEPLSARDVQWFLDDKTAIVRYLVTDSGLLVWVIDSDNIQGKIVKVPEEELKNGIADLLSSLDKKELKDRLSPLIIEPISSLLSNKKRLIIIPDESLSTIPFTVLQIGNDLMVDRFDISYVPSAFIFNAAYEKRNLNKVNILISQSYKYSNDYVEGIGSKTPIFAALKSDKTKFLDIAPNYGMLHITDSFSINQAAPFRSFIQFGKERLSLSELMPLNLNPNLIVLINITPQPSAPPLNPSRSPLAKGGCKGGGELSSHALTPLILSGAPSVLVKTLPTDKDAEEIFMKEFYDAFRKESAAGALAKVQRTLKAKGMSPAIWAGYELHGYPGMNKEEEKKYASQKVAGIMNSAIDAYSKGEWKAAINRFEEGLLFLKAVGAKENLGSIYQALSNASANSGEYAKGASYQDEFMKVSAGRLTKPELAEGYKTLGVLYSRANEDEKAVGALVEALKLWKGLGNKKDLSEGYRTLALLQEKGGRYADSLASFNAALNIDREASNKASEGQDLWDIGRIYYLRLSRFDEALKAYKEALSIFKGLGNTENTAKVLLDIGLVYEQEGEYESARTNYLEGIKIAGGIKDKTVFSRGNLYLANVAWHTGDYQEAFRYQRIALTTAEELKDRKQEAMAHNLAGLTYMNLGMLEKALDSLSRSLAISTETGDKLDAAAAYNNIGIVQRELGNLEKSIESFKSALAIDSELKTKWGMAYDMRNLGISYERMGRLKEALESLSSSLSLSREIGERKNEGMTLYSLGMLYLKKGKIDEAAMSLKEASIIGREVNLPEVIWRSLKAQAAMLIQKNKPADAYMELKEAITVVEKMRGRIKVDEYKTGFLENKTDLYEEMVLLLLRMGRVEEAFNYAERARSRNFIDMLGNQKVNLKSVASQRLLEMERNLRSRIENLEERARGNAALQEELTKARKGYEALLIEIKEESPELSSFVTVEPPTLLDIQKTIPKDTSLLEYMVTKDGIVIWTIGSSRIESTIVPVGRETLKEKVVRYREMMESVTPLEKESLELYNLLVKPVEQLIDGTKYIGIIPHDVLHYLSFSSLFDGKQYLIEAHPIFYSPSASVLKMIVDRNVGATGRMPIQRLLVVGNPDLGDAAYDLPFAEREAGSIGREYEGSELLLRKEATETRVKEDIGKFNGVHFASHGVYDSATPLFSTLKLTRDDANDGNLTANEVFSLNLKASLIIMSACQTGLGKLTTGDEIIGLNRAFIYAGAPSVISTLWRVNDAASAMIVKRFYRSYKNNDLAESLRLAQMAAKEYYPHPAYWAGFGLTGDYR
ncbi:MAG: CHAT domain-containing protein [Deltaproteobacteria bacterium]|nr:CHAT domain-containing protein [Deltaproteobacteria bacterium]